MPYTLPPDPPKRSDFIPDELAASVLSGPLNGAHLADVPFVSGECFHKLEEALTWQVMCELDAEGLPLDVDTVLARLGRAQSPLNDEGFKWQNYLTSLLNHPLLGSVLDFEHNAELLYDRYRRWKIADDAWRASDEAMNLSRPLPPDPALVAQRIKPLTVADILHADLPAPRGPWKGIIPPGLTILGARPKSGKSILMLQLATALGCGGMHFGERVEPMPVLYYTLEDKTRRLQDRMRQMSTPESATTAFLYTIPPLYDGGVDEVIAMLDRYRLIIIDTLERAMPGKDFVKDSSKYAVALGALQSAALERNASIVGIVHRRKMLGGANPDPIDDVFGSTQLTTSADCVLCIYWDDKQAGRPRRARLLGRSRDSEDVELTMSFDRLTLTWQPVEAEEAEEDDKTEAEREILDALKKLGKKVRAATVANAVGAHRGNTSARLQKLWKEGKIRMELIDNASYYFLEEREGVDERHGESKELMPMT
jgi:hypothetical protein